MNLELTLRIEQLAALMMKNETLISKFIQIARVMIMKLGIP